MSRPWEAERPVSADLARDLVARQFPELADARIEDLGAGWDNDAFLVGGEWIFRFPRRESAAAGPRLEAAALPLLAARLPLAVPEPRYLGEPDAAYPWPFVGYRRIPGTTADRAAPDDSRRAAAAGTLGRFLAALHRLPPDLLRTAGAGPDLLGREDVAGRLPVLARRLEEARSSGLLADPAPILAAAEETPAHRDPGIAVPVHGDFYARHLLLDGGGRPLGVIDWGDFHLGDPAVDLSIAHGFLPPAAHGAFRRAYGPIDEPTWRRARFWALFVAATVLVYAADVGDAALLGEAKRALGYSVGREYSPRGRVR